MKKTMATLLSIMTLSTYAASPFPGSVMDIRMANQIQAAQTSMDQDFLDSMQSLGVGVQVIKNAYSNSAVVVLSNNENMDTGLLHSELERLISERQNQNKAMVKSAEAKFLGVNADRALLLSGVLPAQAETDDPCSALHNQGDFSNRWCHLGYTDVAYSVTKQIHFSSNLHIQNSIAFVIAATVPVFKEFAFDENVSESDIPLPTIKRKVNKRSDISFNLFADGFVHAVYQYKF